METIRRNNGLFPSLLGDLENDFFARKEQIPTVAVNIKERQYDYEIEMAVPGIKKEDIDINVEGIKMVVKAEVSNELESNNERFTRKEFSSASFSRSFTLPKDVDTDKIEADYTDGVLSISVPKPESKKKVIKKISLK